MILKMNRKSKGKTGVVEYLLNERAEEGTAFTLRGNSEITKKLIRNIERKHKYLSGGLMFAKEEYISDAQKQEIMDAFEEVLFAGIDSSKYNILWVEHSDKERIELNFVVPRMALDTGNDLDLYSHRRDLPLMDMWKNGVNVKYKLADPNDPRRSRTMTEWSRVARGDGYVVANRKNLDETLHQLVKSRQILSRNQMIELLKKSGYQITRKNEESISVKHTDIGKKALRLKGGIYSEDFTGTRGIESLSEERERRIAEYDTKASQGETRPDRSTYQRYLQTRIDRHKKRYARDEQISTKDTQETYTKNLATKSLDEDKREVEYDRIRKLNEKSRRRREESYSHARARKAELLRGIEEVNLQIQRDFRRTKHELHESFEKSRTRMETNLAVNARRVDAKIIHTDRKSRDLAERVRGLFEGVNERIKSVKTAISGAINKIKKLRLFNQASDEVLSQDRARIRKI